VAIAVERVRNQVQGSEGDEGVEGSGCDAAHAVRVEGEGVQIHQTVEQLLVNLGDRILRKSSENEMKFE
jgi:hypothetical protein